MKPLFTLWCVLLLTQTAVAQLRLPSLPSLPSLPALPEPRAVLAPQALQGLRARTIGALLRRHASVLERDANGEPALRGELLVVAPSAALLDAARAAGYTLRSDDTLPGIDTRLVVLAAPPGIATAAALEQLLAIDPQARIDLHHIYTPSGTASAVPALPTEPPAPAWRVGLIDSGVDGAHPALRRVQLAQHGCGGAVKPALHGTAVASLLAGRTLTLAGSAPGARLYAADVYCGPGPGGSVVAVADALGWFARERVAVINISLVGPANRALQAVVEAMLARGHVLVAAVGNDGPAAPPLFPAAYAGVVGVTGVDRAQRVLPEAGRGPQVMFSARGSELLAAVPGGGETAARGTSFAAPLVAGLLARHIAEPDPARALAAVNTLAGQAIDLGAAGRDDVYGLGLVGAAGL